MGEDKFKQMGIVMGGTYNVSFDVESREWQGKWFTECQAWRTQRVDGVQQAATQTQQQPTPAPHAQIPQDGSHVDDENLPF
jgi:hypothetical protein